MALLWMRHLHAAGRRVMEVFAPVLIFAGVVVFARRSHQVRGRLVPGTRMLPLGRRSHRRPGPLSSGDAA